MGEQIDPGASSRPELGLKALEDIQIAILGALGVELEKYARWFGRALESGQTASAILRESGGEHWPAETLGDLLAFYQGEQWPEAIKRLRMQFSRPLLVVNRLPELVAEALDMQRRAGLPPISAGELILLRAVIAYQNRDAQMLYNYTLSSILEWQTATVADLRDSRKA